MGDDHKSGRKPRRTFGAATNFAIFCAAVLGAAAFGYGRLIAPPAALHPLQIALPPVSGDLDPVAQFVAPPRALVSDAEATSAIAINAATPAADGPVAPARAFLFPSNRPLDYLRARECLAAAAHYEAAGEGPVGEAAVAQVVLNRVRNRAFPNSVCGVVFQGSEKQTGCQFTFTCDGAMARLPNPVAWQRALRVADAALAGQVEASVGTATHYHANWVVPTWRDSLVKLTTVGTHIFYRWPGGAGERWAFRRPYGGNEVENVQMAAVTGTPAPPLEMAATPQAEPGVPGSPVAALDDAPDRTQVAADIERSALRADEQRGDLTVAHASLRDGS